MVLSVSCCDIGTLIPFFPSKMMLSKCFSPESPAILFRLNRLYKKLNESIKSFLLFR